MNKEFKKGLVSIIIPCFNSEAFLAKAIDSVFDQTYIHKEIIVIDDGSTDDTINVIKNYKDTIKYFYKRNEGPASARNMGIRESHGEFIAFLDSDDYWLPHKLERQVKYLKKNHNYGLVHSNTLIQERNKEAYPFFLNDKPPSGLVFNQLFLGNFINNLTVVVRRDIIIEQNGFDENSNFIGIEDYELWCRLSLHCQIGYLDDIVAVYRIHESNLLNEEKNIKSQLVLLNKFKNKVCKPMENFYDILLEKRDILYYRWGCWLMENKMYSEARSKFIVSRKRSYLFFHSNVGLISCLFKTNIFFLSWRRAIQLKRYANYLFSKGELAGAKKYYRKSIRYYPMQKIIFKQFFRIFI